MGSGGAAGAVARFPFFGGGRTFLVCKRNNINVCLLIGKPRGMSKAGNKQLVHFVNQKFALLEAQSPKNFSEKFANLLYKALDSLVTPTAYLVWL